RPARVSDADRAVQVLLAGELLELCDAAAGAQALHAAVDDGDAGGVVAAVLEALQALEQDRHDVAVGYGSDDSAHRVFFRMKRRPHMTAAAAASVTKSRNSALRSGRKIWCTSSKAPKRTTASNTAIGARPFVPRQSSAVMVEKTAKCANLSQPCGMGCEVTKSSAAM